MAEERWCQGRVILAPGVNKIKESMMVEIIGFERLLKSWCKNCSKLCAVTLESQINDFTATDGCDTCGYGAELSVYLTLTVCCKQCGAILEYIRFDDSSANE